MQCASFVETSAGRRTYFALLYRGEKRGQSKADLDWWELDCENMFCNNLNPPVNGFWYVQRFWVR